MTRSVNTLSILLIFFLSSFLGYNMLCLFCTGYTKSIMLEAVLRPPWIVFALDFHGGAFRS